MKSIFSKEILYVDIRGNLIKYVLAEHTYGKDYVGIKKHGSILFAEEYAEQAMIPDTDQTVKTLMSFVNKEKIATKKVYINISSASIILRMVKVPFMAMKDLKDYLEMEISQFLPVNMENNAYDYKVLETVEEHGKKLLNLLITSLPKEIISNYMRLFKKAGLQPIVIDVYPNSISRLYGACGNQDVMVIDLNAEALDIILLKNGKLFMFTSLHIKNKLTIHDTYRILQSKSEVTIPEGMKEILDYAKTYMDFFTSRSFGKKIDVVYLLNDLARVKGINQFLANQLEVKIKIGAPEVFNFKSEESFESALNTAYACNLGLLIRGE